jgi:hypothetical protein
LGSSLKTDYKIDSSVYCFGGEENYVSSSVTVKTPEFSGDLRNIYFFNNKSKFMGMDDVFQPLNNYKKITIGNEDYWINIGQPGPYGISTLGVWFVVIGEKQDINSGTIVRVSNLEIVKDSRILDLVKQYGVKGTAADGKEIYTVSGDKTLDFISKCVDISPELTQIVQSSKKVTNDLNAVTF